MRLRIDISQVKFRVASTARPAARSRNDQTQKTTPDGQLIWSVRLTAIDAAANSSETIWVEVAGEEPKLTLDDLATVDGLVFAPWVNKKNELVRQFRADAISTPASGRSAQAA